VLKGKAIEFDMDGAMQYGGITKNLVPLAGVQGVGTSLTFNFGADKDFVFDLDSEIKESKEQITKYFPS
jgi:uncharacterized lipoprotein NlpE involved in copper resistance